MRGDAREPTSFARDRERFPAESRVGWAATRVAGWLSWLGVNRAARIVAVVAAPILGLVLMQPTPRITGLLAIYVLASSVVRRRALLAPADLLAALLIIVVTQGHTAHFLPFLMVAVAGFATRGSLAVGVLIGACLSGAQMLVLGLNDDLGVLRPESVLPFALVLPLTGVCSALATRVLQSNMGRGRLVLEEANRLLASLRRVADTIPGGLDVATVAHAALAEIREQVRAPHAMILTADNAILRSTASYEIPEGALGPLRADVVRSLAWGRRRSRTFERTDLPAPLARACSAAPYWSITPIGIGDELLGAFLVAGHDRAELHGWRSTLVILAQDTALALDNARLFDGAQARAADTARRQMANDLHDGVAQSLAHLRMELELLARHHTMTPTLRREADRLARVATSALDDVRVMITGLRADAGHDSLARVLEQHVRDLNGLSDARLEFVARGTTLLDEERRQDILRIAQEAVSNALRHGRPTQVSVLLESDPGILRLAVEDDGVGMDAITDQGGTGVGMRAMTERASRLGARLTVRSRVGGGTVVELECPTGGTAAVPLPTA